MEFCVLEFYRKSVFLLNLVLGAVGRRVNISSTCQNICDKQLLSPNFFGTFSLGFFVLQHALVPLF